jgi:hypothetical protein
MAADARAAMGREGDGGKGANLATPTLSRSSDDLELWKVIRFGVPETEMPGHNLTNKEIWQIAGYVRTLGRIEKEPTSGDARRGETLAKGKADVSPVISSTAKGEMPARHWRLSVCAAVPPTFASS